MKRYDLTDVSPHDYYERKELIEDTDGEWVKYAEAAAEIARHKSMSIQLAAFACRLQHSSEDTPEDVVQEARELVKKWKLDELKARNQ